MAKKKAKTRLGRAWTASILGFLVVSALFWLSAHYPAGLELAELKAFDLRMYTRGKQQPTGQVVIAAIDDKSIEHLGRWPWPRSAMARMVDALRYYNVKVIGLDLIFSEVDDQDVQRRSIGARLRSAGLGESEIQTTLGPDNDEAFALALKEQGSAYLGFPFESHRLSGHRNEPVLSGFVRTMGKPPPLGFNLVQARGLTPEIYAADAYLPPVELLNSAARGTAYVDIDADADGVSRGELAMVRFHDRFCVPFFLALVSAYREHAPLSLSLDASGVNRVAVGDVEIPVDELGRMRVNFRGPGGTIPHYSVSDIIDHQVKPASALAGKIVLIGVTGRGLGDRKVTPLDGDCPGVEVHANAVDNVLGGDFIRRSKLTDAEERIIAFLLGLGVSFTVAHLTAAWSLGPTALFGVGYYLYVQHRLAIRGILLPVVFPTLVMVIAYIVVASYRYLTEGLEKRHLRHAFEHYLNPSVIASVVDDPEGLKLGGERRHLSILFADIVDFTSRAERSEPEALIAQLNTYFTRMLNLILESGGVVDKLIGDAIMAFWGAPAEVPNPAKLAIDTAIAMLSELAKLRAEDKRFADFDIGVGIATGDPVVGNLGGERRFDYSVIGDSVNFASRLEGLTRKFKVHLLVSKQTLEEAGGNYLAREVGLVRVKGKHELVSIVEVVGRADDGIDPTFWQRFAEIRRLISEGADRQAVEELHQLELMKPHDHLIELYLEQLNDHLANGSAEPLKEMVFEFESK